MPDPIFAFDDGATVETNLSQFGSWLEGEDEALATILASGLVDMVSEKEPADLWDALFAATMLVAADQPAGEQEPDGATAPCAAPAATVAPSEGAAAAPPPSPASRLPAVSGWLLTRLSVEGFRGINNQGRALELRFHTDKVNSVSAVNGVGKSSVFDALRFAICGRLEWIDRLPATVRADDYYLNRFNTSGQAVIKLGLVAEPNGQACEITVTRTAAGTRTVTASGTWNGEDILAALDREFVFLDGPTFQEFIAARPLERGRTFSGLLGLSAYSAVRQNLEKLSRTVPFNNHFDVTAHTQMKAREDKISQDSLAAISEDFAALVGAPLEGQEAAQAQVRCQLALAQIGPIRDVCAERSFLDIDIDACVGAVKQAEGGVDRERYTAILRDLNDLQTMEAAAPSADRAATLEGLARARADALANTAGDEMLQLFQAGSRALDRDGANVSECPLCDETASSDLKDQIARKLEAFAQLDAATADLALEWAQAGWAQVKALDAVLEPAPELRLTQALETPGAAGLLRPDDAARLTAWLAELRTRAEARTARLTAEKQGLEVILPVSAVEITQRVEAARRLQQRWAALETANAASAAKANILDRIGRVRAFLDRAASSFAVAETAMSRARLASVEPRFRDYYAKLWFSGVEPTVARERRSENLEIRLAKFHGLADLSPQAVLSESYRNAFAIALYLAAASLYGGLPKFIVLDDVTSSFDAGHQNYLVELMRTTFARPGAPAGLQVILLSHDTLLEKLFNKHSASGQWAHQRLEGAPQLSVQTQAGAVNKVRDGTRAMLQAGQVDSAKEGIRQYLEYRLNEVISRVRIPVPIDVAFNEGRQLAGDYLSAIDAAVKLHKAAGSLILTAQQQAGLNANLVTITGNFLSHWGTAQSLTFTAPALLGVMQAIDDYCDCFTHTPTAGGQKTYYRSLSQV